MSKYEEILEEHLSNLEKEPVRSDNEEVNLEQCDTCEEFAELIAIPDPNRMAEMQDPDKDYWHVCRPCHVDMLRIMGGLPAKRFHSFTITKKDLEEG